MNYYNNQDMVFTSLRQKYTGFGANTDTPQTYFTCTGIINDIKETAKQEAKLVTHIYYESSIFPQ